MIILNLPVHSIAHARAGDKGDVSNTIDDILGGLRSTGTYMGANRLKDFPKCCTFVKVNRQVNEVYSNSEYEINKKN